MNYDYSNRVDVSSASLAKMKISVCTVSHKNSSWKYVIASMAFYALQPVVVPIMILFSKLLKCKIEWFPVEYGG